MSVYEDDIRRIAKKDKVKGALSNKADRDPILGSTTPFEVDAFAPSATGDDPVSSDPCSPPDNEPDEPLDSADPNTFGGPVPNNDADGSGGVPNANDFVNGDDGPTNLDDSTTDDIYPPGAGGYGSMKGLEGLYDCKTNAKYDVRFDGQYPDVDGWDDPETPPVDSTYTEGKYWKTDDYSSFGTTVAEAANGVIATKKIWGLSSCPTPEYYAGYEYTGIADEGEYINCNYEFNGNQYYGGSWTRVSQHDCGSSTEDYCNPTEPPVSEECWPSDGRLDIAFIDGVWQKSEYDCNDDIAWEERSFLDLCALPDNKNPIRIEPAFDGGQIITAGESPNRIAKWIKKDGTLGAAGDATDAFIDQYRPK